MRGFNKDESKSHAWLTVLSRPRLSFCAVVIYQGEETHVRSTNHRLGAGLIALIAVAVLSVGMPAAAGAQGLQAETGPTADQYEDPVVKVETSTGEGGSGLTDPVGPLPFTGFDVMAMLGVALAVTGLGLLLQRAVSRQAHDTD